MNDIRRSTSSPALAAVLYAALALLVLLHTDVWWWDDASLVLGLPVALTYHLASCLAATAIFALFVRLRWPSHLEVGDEKGGEA